MTYIPKPIKRSDLEYPTEDVSFAYLEAIEKAEALLSTGTYGHLVTVDSFTDKAVRSLCGGFRSVFYARLSDVNNKYQIRVDTGRSTEDFLMEKCVNGSFTKLASESVDISGDFHFVMFSISGSTLKGFRDDLSTPKITATDTTFSSGKYGYGAWDIDILETGRIHYNPKLLAPATELPKPLAIVEIDKLKQNLVEISQIDNVPDFLKQEYKKYEILKSKGFTDEEIKTLFGDIQTHVDLASVTWGVFDHKLEHNTMPITITAGNPYTGEKAILEQIEYAKSKGLKVLNPPRDYSEAIEQYKQLKQEFTEWIAGKDNYAYQTLGHEDFEKFQVADTYYGNIVDGIKPNAYKNVPDWEMRKTLAMWKERLKRATIVKSEAEKHLKKLEEVEKKGW